jgi:hypothetical protein
MHRLRSLLIFMAAIAVGSSPAAFGVQTIPPAQTPQGKVALAFYKAAKAGDAAALKRVLTEESAKAIDGPTGQVLVQVLKGETQAPVTIKKVTVDGTLARVESEFKAPTGAVVVDTLVLVLVGQEWKVDKQRK